MFIVTAFFNCGWILEGICIWGSAYLLSVVFIIFIRIMHIIIIIMSRSVISKIVSLLQRHHLCKTTVFLFSQMPNNGQLSKFLLGDISMTLR